MKRFGVGYLTVLAVFFLPWIVPGAAFTYRVENGCAVVTGRESWNTELNVVIPPILDGYTVVAVGSEAFRFDAMTTLTLPDTLKSINTYAFRGCRDLGSVNLGSGVTGISDSAFLNCSSLSFVAIPSTVRTLGANVFANCVSLQSVTFLGNAPTSVSPQLYNGAPTALVTQVLVGSKGWQSMGSTALPTKWPPDPDNLGYGRDIGNIANSYTLVYQANGGTGADVYQTVPYGQVANLKGNMFKAPSGKCFVCWKNTKNSRQYDPGILVFGLAYPGERVVFTAGWR